MDIRAASTFDLWLGKLIILARRFNPKSGSEYVIARFTEKVLI